MRTVGWLSCSVAMAALVGCGNVSAPTTEPTTGPTNSSLAGPRGEWRTQSLALHPGTDQAPLLATAGADALVVTISEAGVVRSALSASGGDFELGTPLQTGERFLSLGDVVALPGGGWLAIGSGGSVLRDGDDDLAFEPRAFRSADGLTWTAQEVTGFDQPVDLNDLAVVGETIVVAGDYRSADNPGMGGFEAHVWTSSDGSSFAQIDLPGVPQPLSYRDESYAGRVGVVDDRLVVTGRVGRHASAWTSVDEGATWTKSEDAVLARAYDLTGLGVIEGEVMAGAGGGGAPALRSLDGGITWSEVTGLPDQGEESFTPVWAAGSRWWTLTRADDPGESDLAVCYADLTLCGQTPAPVLKVSSDGSSWTPVAMPDEVDVIVGAADGRVLVLAGEGAGLAVHTLPAGTSPPPAADRPAPERVTLVTPKPGESPEVGVRYHAPMFVHCGMSWLWFGEATWRRTDHGPDLETGAGDEGVDGWPLAGQALYGFATLRDADHLDYSIPSGEVIATYVRDDGAPGCD